VDFVYGADDMVICHWSVAIYCCDLVTIGIEVY
jgi:hypothetical protein